jgi:alcohol dehydrogenase class IV
MPLVGNWNYPTSIRFGAGRIKELPEACKAVGLKRPLLVTDPGLAKLPMIADAMTALRKAGIEVALFSEVKPNPVASNVEAGIRVLRAGKHDGVIAWGGGSGIDTAKATSRTSATGGRAPIRPGFSPRSPCRPPQAQGPRPAGPP